MPSSSLGFHDKESRRIVIQDREIHKVHQEEISERNAREQATMMFKESEYRKQIVILIDCYDS